MKQKNVHEQQLNLFNFFVDTLVDLADPAAAEEQEVIDDMRHVVQLLFEGAKINVVSADGDLITFTAFIR